MTLYTQSPLILSHSLSQLTGKNIYLKVEALQPSGSFKDRGVGSLCEHYAQQNVAGLVCSSGGNAGLAVAYASNYLNIPATIIVPSSTPENMIEKIRAENVNIEIIGKIWDEADEAAQKLAKSKNYAYIPPFNHPIIWQGYTSIIEELYASHLKPDAIIVSVGGGGLYSGLVLGLKKYGWFETTMITAETTGAASFATSFENQKRTKLTEVSTIAVTLAAKQICEQAFNLSQGHPTQPQVVSDQEAVRACLNFADDHRLLVEPACGAALAIPYFKKNALEKFENIVVIVCGGNGVSLDLLNQWRSNFCLNIVN